MSEDARLGDIPEDWEVRKISDLFIVETGTTPSTKKKEYWDSGSISWITPTDLNRLAGKIRIGKSERRITERGLKETNLSLLPKSSIIISTRAPVGYVATLEEESTFNQGCKGLIPINKIKTSPEFYCYYLIYKKQSLQNLSGGSTFKELSKERLEQFSIPFPPYLEQEKIAEVLSTVDQTIEKVGDAIEKTQRLKKGLMQELLTKGIGHKESKSTEVGRIPRKWAVKKIKDVGKILTGKTPPTNNALFWQGEIPFITPADIKEANYVYETERNVTKEVLEQFGRILPKNAILVVCIGSTIGKMGLTCKESVTNQQINAVICNDEAYPQYVFYALLFKNKIFKLFSGVAAVPIIKKSIFQEIKFPLPNSITEQQQIAGILSSVDKRIEALRNRKERLKNMKKGLMEDLLTGRKRVTLEV
jgi:type I restriction enzyme S subunit